LKAKKKERIAESIKRKADSWEAEAHTSDEYQLLQDGGQLALNGIRKGYRDHILNQHRQSGKSASTFSTRLTVSALKPHITRIVQSGIAA
jgi:hypothetical protein